MTRTRESCKFPGQANWSRGAFSCLALDIIHRMPQKASRDPKICPKPRSFGAPATSRIGLVRVVASRVSAVEPRDASCTTWAIWSPGGRAIFIWFTPSIVVRAVGDTSTRICLTTPCPRPITRIASFLWPCDSSWRTACPIKPPVGTCGATIAFSSLTPPSRTGWRPGGKKAARHMDADYLDWALADFDRRQPHLQASPLPGLGS